MEDKIARTQVASFPRLFLLVGNGVISDRTYKVADSLGVGLVLP
jgi:hypothetical protein